LPRHFLSKGHAEVRCNRGGGEKTLKKNQKPGAKMCRIRMRGKIHTGNYSRGGVVWQKERNH